MSAIVTLAAMRVSSRRVLWWTSIVNLVVSVSLISVVTLDANSIRVAETFCSKRLVLGPGFSATCDSLSMIGLVAGEGGAVLVSWLFYLSTKALYKYVRTSLLIHVSPSCDCVRASQTRLQRPASGAGKPDDEEERFTAP